MVDIYQDPLYYQLRSRMISPCLPTPSMLSERCPQVWIFLSTR